MTNCIFEPRTDTSSATICKHCGQEKFMHQQNDDIVEEIFYAVMKLNTDIEYINPFSGTREDVKLGGLAGYIPVFNSLEEATESSQDGKYQILAIKSLKQHK